METKEQGALMAEPWSQIPQPKTQNLSLKCTLPKGQVQQIWVEPPLQCVVLRDPRLAGLWQDVYEATSLVLPCLQSQWPIFVAQLSINCGLLWGIVMLLMIKILHARRTYIVNRSGLFFLLLGFPGELRSI